MCFEISNLESRNVSLIYLWHEADPHPLNSQHVAAGQMMAWYASNIQTSLCWRWSSLTP